MRGGHIVVRLVPALLLMGALATPVRAQGPLPWPPGPIDEEEECLEATPAQASLAGITDDGGTVVLDILVLLNGVTLEDGRTVMTRAAQAYKPLGIDLGLRYETVAFEPDTRDDSVPFGDHQPAFTSKRLFELSKKHTGGTRPADIDIVYTMTAVPIVGGTAGVADCIGGVRYAHRAFAIGEYEEDNQPDYAINTYLWASSKIAAHEIGHLMGAHHHYANCGEGATEPGDVQNRDVSPCSLMFNESYFLSLWFSTINGTIVRGHAVNYADAGSR